MREILELQTGQVAFLSGLLSGFSLTIAVHILRIGMRGFASQCAFICLLVTTALFLISLYVDVRLTIEMAGLGDISQQQTQYIANIRVIGTGAATAAFALFVFSIGLLGWIGSNLLGVLSTLVAASAFGILVYVWYAVQHIS